MTRLDPYSAGMRFRKLVLVERAANDRWRDQMWVCRCDCGTLRVIRARHLREGVTSSCGCSKIPTDRPRYQGGSLLERFWRKVRKGDGCWEWTGNRSHAGEGYGQMWQHGRLVHASRISWEIHNGPIPEGVLVLHRCDNPPCIRPDHLFLGSVSDNAIDMVQKGRCRNAKLTVELVMEIRQAWRDGADIGDLAALFSITRSHARNVISGKTWTHVL